MSTSTSEIRAAKCAPEKGEAPVIGPTEASVKTQKRQSEGVHMNEVSTRPRRAATPVTAPPTQAQLDTAGFQGMFSSIGLALDAASLTDEPHEWSGDSDRLLRIASFLAERDAGRTYNAEEAECSAYDIAALIKAARLVPGESESRQRSDLIASAEAHLVVLTDDVDCLVTGAARAPAPSRGNSQSVGASSERDAEMLGNEAIAVNGLVEWVVSANDVLHEIRTRSLHSAALDAELSKHGIRVNSPDWASCDMGNEMSYLLGHQKALILKLVGAAA